MERVSVIIPNWNGKQFLGACLASLRRQTCQDFVIYVVDNGSSDGSVEFIQSMYPEVRLISHPENRGFSAAINSGIEGSRGEYIAALNNDTEADPRWMEMLLETMEARPEIGFFASKVLDYKDRTIIDSFGDGYTTLGIAYKIGVLEKDVGQFEDLTEVFSACAAAACYRRSMFDDIGVFDEDFFCYMEDIDIGIRARLAGYRCLAVPAARVYHIGSATTGGDMSEFSVRMTAKNIFNVLLKDIPAPMLFMMLPKVIAAQTVLVFQSLFTRQRPKLRKNMRGYWQGIGGALRQAPLMLRKRRDIQRARRISSHQFSVLLRASEQQKRAGRGTLAISERGQPR